MILWYPPLTDSFELTWHMLTHAMTENKKSIKPWWFIFLRVLVSLLCLCYFFLSQAWLWRLLLSRLSLPSLLLAFTYTERECCPCFQISETKLFQRVHYKFLCMPFRTIQVNFYVLPLKLSNHLSFCEPFLAHEEVLWVILYLTCQTDLPLY